MGVWVLGLIDPMAPGPIMGLLVEVSGLGGWGLALQLRIRVLSEVPR